MDPKYSMMFERQMEADNKSEHTVRSYRRAAEIMDLVPYSPYPYDGKAEFEIACIQWLRDNQDDLSASTIGVRAAGFKYIAKVLWDADILGSFKAPKVNDFEPHPLPGMMDDVRRVIEAADNITERRLVALLGYCGLRVSEALVVTSEDFRHEITDDETVVWLRVKGRVAGHEKSRSARKRSKCWNWIIRWRRRPRGGWCRCPIRRLVTSSPNSVRKRVLKEGSRHTTSA